MRYSSATALLAAAVVATWPTLSVGYDPATEFAKGTWILSLQVGGGAQDFERGGQHADISFVDFTPRASVVATDPIGPGWLRGAIETGIEGWLQQYVEPEHSVAAGLKAAVRYHFLGVGRLVPYVEVTAGAGGSTLEVLGYESPFTFVLEGGTGLSYVITAGVALTAGYRHQHLSNGGTQRPNRGYDANTGTVGVSIFFH